MQERNDLPHTFDDLLSEHLSILRCYSSFVCVPSDRGKAVRTEVTLSPHKVSGLKLLCRRLYRRGFSWGK